MITWIRRVSTCCGAPITVESAVEGFEVYSCNHCKQSCDFCGSNSPDVAPRKHDVWESCEVSDEDYDQKLNEGWEPFSVNEVGFRTRTEEGVHTMLMDRLGRFVPAFKYFLKRKKQ